MTISLQPLIKPDERFSVSGFRVASSRSVSTAISTRQVVATTKVRIDDAARNLASIKSDKGDVTTVVYRIAGLPDSEGR